MITINCTQGTSDWFNSRLAIPTASQFHRIMTNRLEKSKQWEGYANELLADWLAGKFIPKKESTFWMERGTEMEDQARANYELDTGNTVNQVGFIYLDERRNVGCSPDGLVDEIAMLNHPEYGPVPTLQTTCGLIEVKCPKPSTMVSYYHGEELPAKYRQQVQGQLWITGREWCDFYAFHPDMKPFMIRVYREEEYIDALSKMVERFNEYLEERKKDLEGWRV